MKITDFTEEPGVFHLIEDLKKEKVDKKEFSDIMDDQGNQYIELVQEGGGVLGVALVGYTYVLEQMGLRFFSHAGTSAGSINALLLASLGHVNESKGDELIQILANKNLYDFVDGDSDAEDFVRAIVNRAGRVKLIWKGIQVIDNLYKDLGLNPGDNFFNWLSGILKGHGAGTTEKFLTNFRKLPSDLKIREGINRNLEGLTPRFGVITSDVTTETKVEFPAMASLYWDDPGNTDPAYYVRASMSIPYFFKPLKIEDIPAGPEAMSNWNKLVRYKGKIPEEVYFIDGGIMSNFPIDIFHKFNTIPRLPTFGVRLGIDRNSPNQISNPLSLFGAIFNSIRHLHDYDFILKHPDYKQLIQHIDIGDHDWLNFNLSDESKIDLFKRGTKAAAAFLRKFDWNAYKEKRAELITRA